MYATTCTALVANGAPVHSSQVVVAKIHVQENAGLKSKVRRRTAESAPNGSAILLTHQGPCRQVMEGRRFSVAHSQSIWTPFVWTSVRGRCLGRPIVAHLLQVTRSATMALRVTTYHLSPRTRYILSQSRMRRTMKISASGPWTQFHGGQRGDVNVNSPIQYMTVRLFD